MHRILYSLFFISALLVGSETGYASSEAIGLGVMDIQSSAATSSGNILIGRADGLYLATPQSSAMNLVAFDGMSIRSIASSPDATVYVSVEGVGIYKNTSADFNSWTCIDPISGNTRDEKAWWNIAIDSESVVYRWSESLGVERSLDYGSHWMPINSGIDSRDNVTCLAIYNYTSVMIGTRMHGVMQFDETTNKWTVLSPSVERLPEITSLCLLRDGTILASGNVDVYRSNDHGITWAKSVLFTPAEQRISANVYSITQASNGMLYAATSNGVFVSADKGKQWNAISHGENPAVRSIVIASGVLYTISSNGISRLSATKSKGDDSRDSGKLEHRLVPGSNE